MEKKTLLSVSVLAIMLAAFLWAFEGIVLTPRLSNLDAAVAVLLIHLVTFAVLNVFLWREYRMLSVFSLSDYIYLGLIALFGGALGTLAIVKALFLVHFQQLSVVLLLQQLQPVFAILLAVILLKESAGARFYFWAAVAFVASYFLAFGFGLPNFNTGADTTYAALLAVFAAFAWGSATVFGRKVAAKYKYTTVAFYRAGFTMVIMLFLVLILSEIQGILSATAFNWTILLIDAITSGTISMFIYYWGLHNVKAMVSTIAELFFPVSSVALDYLVNGTVLTTVQWVSAILMVVAILRIGALQRRRKKAPAAA